MLTMSIGKSKDFFFDRERVVRAMDAATRKALSKGGAFVMRGARKSIKEGKVRARGRAREGETPKVVQRVSAPGNPPYSRTGLLRNRILFAAVLGPGTGSPSVVVGPERINKSSGAPETLEFGGTTVVERRRSKGGVERRTVRIAARPYMAPALAREASKLPEQFRNAVLSRG